MFPSFQTTDAKPRRISLVAIQLHTARHVRCRAILVGIGIFETSRPFFWLLFLLILPQHSGYAGERRPRFAEANAGGALRISETEGMRLSPPRLPNEGTLATELEGLSSQFDLTVNCTPTAFLVMLGRNVIEGEQPSESAVERFLRTMIAEIGLYPRNVFRNAKVRRIVLCNRLALDGKRISGLACSQFGCLFFDVYCGRQWCVRSLNHEIFHMLETHGAAPKSNDWTDFNPNGFEYGHRPRSPYDLCEDKHPGGFVDGYTTTSISEDQAETFSFMMAHGGSSALVQGRPGRSR